MSERAEGIAVLAVVSVQVEITSIRKSNQFSTDSDGLLIDEEVEMREGMAFANVIKYGLSCVRR